MINKLKQLLDGDVVSDDQTREFYSHDTSLFEVMPSAVVMPKTRSDLKQLVKFVSKHKDDQPQLSITARSGGSDMSGGAINDSLIVDFSKHLNRIGEVETDRITVEPGAWYRDFEAITLQTDQIMPSYPASRELCAIGGMVANNAGGEKSLIHGKTERYVKRLKVILADGNEYELCPLSENELQQKISQDDFEGQLYKRLYQLLDDNYDLIKQAKPRVTKNSTGYKLWDVWDREAKTFDLAQLFVGAQGTLGLITEVEFQLVKQPKHSGVLVGYAESLDHMSEMIEELQAHNPVTIEAFDKHTLKFAFRFFLQFRKGLGWSGLIKLALQLIPDVFILGRILPNLPEMIFIASFESDDYDEIKSKLDQLRDDIKIHHWKIYLEEAETEAKSFRFWLMRRKSFKLLRDNVKGGLHTAPFIDDLVVPTDRLAEFWPRITEVLDRYELLYTIAGHLGDGNFHIIPLMDLTDETERAKIEPCLREVIDLVKEHDGVISGEHNDGLIRSPFLEEMYGTEVVELFAQVKEMFDPKNIFNPHKKTDADWQWSKDHIRDHF